MNYLGMSEPLSAAELDRRLQKAVQENERSEKLICVYLNQIKRRRLYADFGFENIYDYALERFGFCHSKTRALLFLARRLSRLPQLTEAVAKERLGWTKAVKVASVATPETEEEWVEKAVESSYKELTDALRDGTSPHGGRVSLWLNSEQMAIWAQALELCRRVSGEQIDPGLALEYIAGEFLATYAAPAEELVPDESTPNEAAEARDDGASRPDDSSETEDAGAGAGAGAGDTGDARTATPEAPVDPATLELSRPLTAEIDPRVEARLCPENDDLPAVEAKCYAAVHKAVLERDGYRCQYPGCSVRHGLHVHHIELRSHFGRKSWAQMNDPSNLIVLCYFHHRMLHAGIIGLKGRAPQDLDWRRPKLLESARLGYEGLGELAAPMDEEIGLDARPPGLRPAESIAELAAAVSTRR